MSSEQMNSVPEPSYPAFWLDHVVYYDTSGSEADDARQCLVSDSYIDSDSSYLESDDDESDPADVTSSESNNIDYYYGRNKYKWFKTAPSRAAQTRQPIEPSTNITDNDGDIMAIWKKLLDDDILKDILRWTNVKLRKSRAETTEPTEDLDDLDMCEFLSFIGILVYSAVFRSNSEDADFLFANDGTGRDIFKCVMSKERSINLLKNIRFNDSGEKEAKKTHSILAAMSNILQIFVNNCQSLYNVGLHVTVNEALIPFNEPPCLTHHRKRCEKLSLQIMCLCDAKTGYFYNGFISKGEVSETEGMTEDELLYSVPTRSVLRLSRPLYGTDRNVTSIKTFTSIELIDALKTHGLSYVGDVSKNMKEVPASFLPSRARERGSTLYAFTNQITLASYVHHKRKALIVASSMHHDDDKSKIISNYMYTNGGVAKLDMKRQLYSCSRHTHRASLAIFYWILDMSLINTHIAYNIYHGTKVKRFDVLLSLARCLVLEQLQRRAYDTQLPLGLRMTIMRTLGPDKLSAPGAEATPTTESDQTCYSCSPKLKRKATNQCHTCKRHICSDCTRHLCHDCAE